MPAQSPTHFASVKTRRPSLKGGRQEIIYRHQATHQLKFFRPNGQRR